MNILLINWSGAFNVVIFGFVMVFMILIILVEIIKIFGKFFAPKIRVRNTSKETKLSENDTEQEFVEDHMSAEYSAAIALALHLYYSDPHDIESQIITIKTVERRYSPWSSKIYGINNLVK